MAVPSGLPGTFLGMGRLRPLSEAECYARLYRGWEPTVTVLGTHEKGAEEPGRLSGEALRRLFEERLLLREDEKREAEAA